VAVAGHPEVPPLELGGVFLISGPVDTEGPRRVGGLYRLDSLSVGRVGLLDARVGLVLARQVRGESLADSVRVPPEAVDADPRVRLPVQLRRQKCVIGDRRIRAEVREDVDDRREGKLDRSLVA
jgi:hypothetical protein